MAIDPVTGALISGGISAIGNIFGGDGGAGERDEERLREQRLQSRGQLAMQANRSMQFNPLRDRLLFSIMQRLGSSPGSFRPTDIFNGAPPSMAGQPGAAGGVDLDAIAKQRGTYTPGAGGVTNDIERDFVSRLGYGPNPLRRRPQGGLIGRILGENKDAEFERRMGGY